MSSLSINEKIKMARVCENLTQEEMMKAAGIKPGTYRNIEQKSGPSWENFQKIVQLPQFRKYALWFAIDQTHADIGQVAASAISVNARARPGRSSLPMPVGFKQPDLQKELNDALATFDLAMAAVNNLKSKIEDSNA